MSEIDIPAWVLDAQREARGINFGRIPLELVVANGQTTKVIGTKTTSTKFKNNDDALLYVLDYIRTQVGKTADLPQSEPKNGGTISLSVVYKNGKISLVNSFENVEYNYPMY